MLRLLGTPRMVCDRVSRREILRIGGAGWMSGCLPDLLAASSMPPPSTAKAKSVIFLLLFGGPSQLETFDMKPDAPEKIRGPFRPIASRTPELRICEHLPKLAAISDKYRVVRTMSHSWNDHSGGAHYIQTGHRWHVPIGAGFSPTPNDWPSMGSVIEHQQQHQSGPARQKLPSYMVIPNSLGRLQEQGQYPRPGEHAGWLGARYQPLTTRIDKRDLQDNPYWRNCTDQELQFRIQGMAPQDGLTIDRWQQRSQLLDQLNRQRRALEQFDRQAPLDALRQRAMDLVTSPEVIQALDLSGEPAGMRDLYGRHLFGQSTLMARRLVEAGVRYVTVHYDCVDGYSWDSHQHSEDVRKHLLPTFDQSLSALLIDLDQRGLLDETLVIATGEMGRTPTANAQWGRDHWSTLFSAVFAGAGIPGGSCLGRSDADAAYPIDDPVSPEDFAATIYQALGIDPNLRLLNAENRPTPIVDGGRPIESLWS